MIYLEKNLVLFSCRDCLYNFQIISPKTVKTMYFEHKKAAIIGELELFKNIQWTNIVLFCVIVVIAFLTLFVLSKTLITTSRY